MTLCRHILAAAAFILGLAASASAEAAVISAAPSQALTATPFTVSFGANAATFAFTLTGTGNGPGAAVATGGNGTVSSFLGGVADFDAGSPIDQDRELYTFSPFSAAMPIPNSAADDFIGLGFALGDGQHFGYAEVAGDSLVSYGYESSPGTSILTGAVSTVPEPASMALLAMSAASVVATGRRKRP